MRRFTPLTKKNDRRIETAVAYRHNHNFFLFTPKCRLIKQRQNSGVDALFNWNRPILYALFDTRAPPQSACIACFLCKYVNRTWMTQPSRVRPLMFIYMCFFFSASFPRDSPIKIASKKILYPAVHRTLGPIYCAYSFFFFYVFIRRFRERGDFFLRATFRVLHHPKCIFMPIS